MAKKNGGKKFISVLTGIICVIITVICALIIIFNFTHSYSQVKGTSMYPTFNENKSDEDYVFISKTKKYTHGDIIVAERELVDGKKRIVKRVIAMENDKIKIEFNDDKYEIYIIYSGESEPTLLKEDYLPQGYTNKYLYEDFSKYLLTNTLQVESGYLVIPEKHLFILGDNRENGESYDSADYGPISYSKVIGKVDYVVYGGRWRYIQVIKQLFGYTKTREAK